MAGPARALAARVARALAGRGPCVGCSRGRPACLAMLGTDRVLVRRCWPRGYRVARGVEYQQDTVKTVRLVALK